MTYAEKLLDPRWQKRKTEILIRDDWKCISCGDTTKTLHVHHLTYFSGYMAWQYPDDLLATLCIGCHDLERGRTPLENALLAGLKVVGFLYSDLLCLSTSIHRKEFTNELIKKLRSIQNG